MTFIDLGGLNAALTSVDQRNQQQGQAIAPATGPALKPPQNEQELRSYVLANFGPAMLAYLSHPELGPKLREAARLGYNDVQFRNAIKQTTWWRTQADTQRQWDLLRLENPAEAERQLDQVVARIGDLGNQLGISFDVNQARKIAEDAKRFGWTEEQVNDVLAGLYDPRKGAAPGMGSTIEAMANQLKESAAGYMVTGDDVYFRTLAKRIATGEASPEGITALFQQQAKARFPWLANIIDQGITPADFFRPYRQTIATELEVSEASIDLLRDTRWQALLSPVQRDGQTRPMTLTEVQRMARSRPEWKSTRRARDMTAQVGNFLLERFGEV